ncbi:MULTISPECIES: restriction endonuclease subunit S [Vibrio]|uniref:restriction endonuclease subunit S n=1 Tax=Vibrio TaxID=662 RepID=UPI0021CF11C2|nr:MULTISPECIES: restriction endonuclease subunit S [unclassified Vibrio]MDW1744841.1 restriction endonuclease subunit S [Vibrio sp. Vb2531]MDW3640404.1 restriction endonuclease subunit S [Vibrio sp. 1291-1]
MSNLVSDGWKKVTLNQVVDRIRTIVNGEPENVLTISSTGGWVDQRQKWARDMAGESLKKYTHLETGELSYNRGNSKTYPYGCVFKLKNWTSAAVPNVYHSFRTKEDMIDASFIEYAFHSGVFDKQLSQIITSSARANGLLNITAKDFFDLELLVPPLPEQKKIAAILTSVDDVIEKTQAQIDKLKDLKTGMMQELLTRGVGVDGKPHTEFKDSSVGKIPKGWDCCLLDKVAKRGSGHTPDKKKPEYWNDGVKWVSLTDSSKLDKLYISDTAKKISQLGIENSSATLHPKGTVVMARDAGVGKSAIMTSSMAVSQHFMAWVCGEKLDNYFLYYLLQHWKPQFEAIAMGSTIKTIGLPYFKKLQIPVPSIEEQRVISGALKSVDNKMFALERKHKQLTSTKKALMQDLLTGKVRVKVEG